jgi:hypothetical protein
MAMATLSTWECASYLYGSHMLEVHLYLMDLNMRQRRWLELINDYELEVHYHLGKENIIADALSHKAQCNYLLTI